MTFEYRCPEGPHTISQFFRSFKDSEPFIDRSICPEHGTEVERIVSAPLAAHLYGDTPGFYNPSPTKRFTTKTVSKKDGNKHAI